ncbi:uncharacterized protein LOC106089184 [Stomoxys calcitrans]|uniref:Chitin-binding type-2 domain-containing protein n=1 Tax=Stomoxys calcitrans TaxID=35570 RepID=A0A1I8NPG4_STOCA|nr:uncharacterized protein LOC106089184 [Stomoxys calcitrans]
MKKIFLATIALLSLAAYIQTATIVDDGKPECDSLEKMNTTFFRNLFDSTAYWICVELYEPAVMQRCPDQTAFLDSVKSCVQWDDWEWEDIV